MSAQNVAPVAHERNLHVLPHAATSTSALVLDGDSLDKMMRLAEVMATGRATLPKHFNGNPADCLAVVMQSMQWKMNPFAVAQKTHLVNGVLGYEAQLVNAVITTCAPVMDRLHYEWFGAWEKVIGQFTIKNGDKGEYRVPGWKLEDEQGLGVKVWATFRGEDEPRVLELLLAQARTRNSTLWADDPRQQLAYLATKRWSRLYCPDVILGVYSPDELEESAPTVRDVSPRPTASPDELRDYPDDKLAENLPKWRAAIDAGRSTPEKVIATIASKYTLTDQQIETIQGLAPIEGEPV
ncbi:RecT family protein [Pseudomonas sp. LAMO17WK12:I10]|uniref:recombinase RecT n=1 Tax=unclassified Pseudomonas TaxID=196821 RepID=UPI000BD5EADE|nr:MULTISPECIES: recombinase RecT [unclassified Pseudomonas]PXX71830.1 RecT family protein [Pseudomonas sp. LAMO17WK12:I9]SNY29245.1 RecT family protein [Pseudomonas sp. LAMO17WK12:I10]